MGDWVFANFGTLRVSAWRCPNEACAAPWVTVTMDGRVVDQWPTLGSGAAPAGVPDSIASDWREAHIDLGVRSWKSAAMMARRAVQGVCIERGAKPGKLASQIEQLRATNALHSHIVDWATEIRYFGNDGAHPGDDGLNDVTEAEARDAINFLDELLRWVYTMPVKLDEAKARRTT